MNHRAKLAWLLVLTGALYSVSGCGGEVIRLGDGRGGASSAAGRAGGGSTAAARGGSESQGGTSATAGFAGMTVTDGGSVSPEAGAGGSDGGMAGAPACAHGRVAANEVIWLGDSWITIPGNQYTGVKDRARASGALGASEDYVNLAAAAASMDAVAKQYEAAKTGTGTPKVLIMDGGTWDAISAKMSGASVDDAVSAADVRFRAFLSEVANDGTVEHIVYFLVPPLPTIAGVDSLRPLFANDCNASSVPCHFIDLKDAWDGHADYTGPSGIQASESGADVIAQQIWATMTEACIAQ